VNVTPLALHSTRAVRDALRAHGWDGGTAATTAEGAAAAAFHMTGLDDASLEALVHFGGRLGLEVLTGPGWALVAGSRSRLSAFARPWTVPEPLREAAMLVGLALPPEAPRAWRTAAGDVPLDPPVIVGILNVTPDSFSDGGAHAGVDAAIAHAERMLAEGAGILDLGGESTRPGRDGLVAEDEELARVLPVLEALVRRFPGVVVSIDTMKAGVARAALAAGAAAVNDVTAFRHDPGMADVVAGSDAGAILMHSRGPALEIASADRAEYGDDPVGMVLDELRQSLHSAAAAGIGAERIVLDPGLGFSKTAEQSLQVLDQLAAFASLGRPLLVGPSRKRFLGAATGREIAERDTATAAACALAWDRGARLFRVHDVAAARDALLLAHALGGPAPTA
jgi:dihydropteroate synthase